MIVTLISPDNLTMKMFIDFYSTIYSEGREVFLIPINSSFSQDQKSLITQGIQNNISVAKDLVFVTFKIPKSTSNIKCSSNEEHYSEMIPYLLHKISSYVVAFDIYSTTPVIIKDRYNKLPEILQRWEINIKKFGGV